MIASCRMGLQLNLINHCTTVGGLLHTWIPVRKDRRYRRAPDRQLTKRSNFVNTAGQPQDVGFSLSPRRDRAIPCGLTKDHWYATSSFLRPSPRVGRGTIYTLKNMCQTNTARNAEWKYVREPSARAQMEPLPPYLIRIGTSFHLPFPFSSSLSLPVRDPSFSFSPLSDSANTFISEPFSFASATRSVRALISLSLMTSRLDGQLLLARTDRNATMDDRAFDRSLRGKQVAFRCSRQAEAAIPAIYRSLTIATSCPQLSTDKTSPPLCVCSTRVTRKSRWNRRDIFRQNGMHHIAITRLCPYSAIQRKRERKKEREREREGGEGEKWAIRKRRSTSNVLVAPFQIFTDLDGY